MPFGVRVQGLEETVRAMGVRVDNFRAAFDAAVFVVAGRVITAAMELAPVRTGRLRRSRFVTRTTPVQAGFGAEYAAVVHEVGRHRKFLTRALSSSSPRLAAEVASVMRAAPTATLATAIAVHPTAPNNGGAEPPRRSRSAGPARRAR